MNKVCVIAICLLVPIFFISSTNIYAGLSDWKIISMGSVKDNPKLVHVVWETARPPYGAFDKIKLHRVVKKSRMFGNKKVILMIPGTWDAGGWSEITDPDVNNHLYLANKGYDVYTIAFRPSNIPNMDYDQFAAEGIDISCTTDWNYAVFREDIKDCVNLIKKISSVNKIFMSGFSRGGIHMYIYASKYQDDLIGLVNFDWMLKKLPPSETPLDEETYMQLINLFKSGYLIDPETNEPTPWLYGVFYLSLSDYNNWKLAGTLPHSTYMVGGQLPNEFEEISDYVAYNAHHVWNEFGSGEGVLTNYLGGLVDRDVLVTSLNEFTRYYPTIHTLEMVQLFAYDDVPYLDYDDTPIDLPMISFLTPHIGCIEGTCFIDVLPNMSINDDVTFHYLEQYGHMDILIGKDSLKDVKEPMLSWLNSHVNGSSRAERILSDQEIEAHINLLIKSFLKGQSY